MTRNHDPTGHDVIRVSFRSEKLREHEKIRDFRDDDGNFMRANNVGKKFGEIVQNRLKGIEIAGKTYSLLGCSGSQQRDHGAYFMLEHRVEHTLAQLG